MFFFFFVVGLGLLVFLLYNVHYLILLLRIEMILLGVAFFLYGRFFGADRMVGILLFFLLMACMGGFRVSLLVSLFRGLGQDF